MTSTHSSERGEQVLGSQRYNTVMGTAHPQIAVLAIPGLLTGGSILQALARTIDFKHIFSTRMYRSGHEKARDPRRMP